SGMPMPTSAPVTPPIAPPTPTPASVAMIGTAAMNGPSPGMDSAPTPTSQPSTPPAMAPVPAPVDAPSGALVDFSCANSFELTLSENNTEMSVGRNPWRRNISTPRSNDDRVG